MISNFKWSIMKKTRFTQTQIVKATQEHENGRDPKDLCLELGISTAAFYKSRQTLWRHGSTGIKKTLKSSKKRIVALNACMLI
jgi:hypothetical protein